MVYVWFAPVFLSLWKRHGRHDESQCKAFPGGEKKAALSSARCRGRPFSQPWFQALALSLFHYSSLSMRRVLGLLVTSAALSTSPPSISNWVMRFYFSECCHKFQKRIKAPKSVFHRGSLQRDLSPLPHAGTWALLHLQCQKHELPITEGAWILSQRWWLVILKDTNLVRVVLWVLHLHIFSNAYYVFDLKK